ncbi:MAG: hypothetical protein ACOYD0_12070 [Candidatus Nanopelagicales bacterium]
MKGVVILAVTATVGLAALTGCATSDSASPTSEASPSNSQTGGWMLVETANGGVTFTKNGDGTYLATLAGVSTGTIAFSDRPSRQARQIPTAQVAESWPQWFGRSSPNAALVDQVDRSSRAVIVQLSDPKYLPKKAQMTYRVRLVDPTQTSSSFQSFADNALPQPQDSTDSVSVFIDNTAPSVGMVGGSYGGGIQM